MAKTETTMVDQKMRGEGFIPAMDAAGWAGKHVSNIYVMLEKGTLEGLRVGRARYVKLASLRQYLGPAVCKILKVPER